VSLDTEIKGDPASIRHASSWLRDTLAPALDKSVDALNDARKTWKTVKALGHPVSYWQESPERGWTKQA